MKYLLNLTLAIIASIVLKAQETGKISGTINEITNQKVAQVATISLLKSTDSSLIATTLVTNANVFSFNQVKYGSYIVAITATGYQTLTSPIVELSSKANSVNIGVLTMSPVNKNLKEVVVLSKKKQMIEVKADRVIVNVDAAISNTGTTAMEVLEKSPGVSVDKDGNISLKGKQGILIMLDGKPAYVSGTDLTNLLKNMPSVNIDQIEIMTNPSAKYDAAGNAGIINIKTKKSKQKGFNGSINVAYGQGFNPKTNNSLQMNYRTGKFNFFTAIGANYRENKQTLDITRKYKNSNQSVQAIFEQQSNEFKINHNYNVKLGADFYASKKTTIGVVLTGFTTPGSINAFSTSYLKSNTNIIDSIITAATNEKSTWQSGAINVNFRHQFDSLGKELTADVDYVTYVADKNQNFINTSYNSNWGKKFADNLLGELPSVIKIGSVKIDYTQPLKAGYKLEAGFKNSFVTTDNTAAYYNVIGAEKLVDVEKTFQFKYKENINAAYVNLNKEFKKWSFQSGLRIENTNIMGNQFGNPIQADSNFTQHYTSLFPTLFVSYNANEKHQFSASYGRRINRPDYEDLNPFLFFIDKFTYGGGNPFLRPSYANVIEASHTYNQFLTTTISFTNTKNLFADVFTQKNFATVVTKDNFGQTNNASISINAQIPIKKWWTMMAYTEYNYSAYKGVFAGEAVTIEAGNAMVNINNQFTLNKGWSAELSGFYRSPGIEGQILIQSLGQVNLGIQKQLLAKKATIKFNIRDAFFTMKANGVINFQLTEANFSQIRDSRVATLSFMYRFGKPIKGIKKRNGGGASTEQNRVKGAN